MIYQLRHQQRTLPTDGAETGLAMQAFREPDTPEWQNAWAVTDRLVVEIAGEAKAHGAAFVVLMANCGIEVDPQDAARERVLERLGVTDLLYPERRMARPRGRPRIHGDSSGRGHAQVLSRPPGVLTWVRQHSPGHRALE